MGQETRNGGRSPARAGFAGLLSEVCVGLLGAAPAAWGRRFEGVLASVASAYGLDRISVRTFDEQKTSAERLHQWPSDAPGFSSRMVPDTALAWSWERLVAGQTVRVGGLEEVSSEAERAPMRELAIGAVLLVPLVCEGESIGFLAALSRSPRAWRDAEVAELEALAALLAAAVSRQRADVAERTFHGIYQNVVEDQVEPVGRGRPDGTLLFANESLARLVGRRREELTGANGFDLFQPAEGAPSLREIARGLRPEDPVRVSEQRLVSSEGKTTWLQVTLRGIFDEEGRLHELQGVGRDVTQLKAAQADLVGQLRFRSLLGDIATSFAASIDPVEIDAHIEEALGRIGPLYGADRVVLRWYERGGALLSLHHAWVGEGVPRPERFYEFPWLAPRVFAGEVVQIRDPSELPPEACREAEILRSTGTRSLLAFTAVSDTTLAASWALSTTRETREWSREEVAQLRALAAVFVGAFARARAERELRRSEARFRSVVEDQSELIVRWRPEGGVTFVNDACCRSFGASREELLGADVWTRAFGGDPEAARIVDKSLRPDAPTVVVECPLVLGGERRHLRWVKRGIFDDAGHLVELQAVGRDVSEERRAARETARRLEFQTLFASLSSGLLRTRPESLGVEMVGWLRRIARDYGLRGAHFLWFEPPSVLSSRDPGRDVPSIGEIEREVGWIAGRVRRGDPLRLASRRGLPPEAASDAALLERLGVASMLVVPIRVEGALLGSCAFTRVEEGEWTDETEMELRLLAQAFASAHSRHVALEAVADRERALARAERASGVGSFEVDVATGAGRVSDGYRELLGLPEGPISLRDVASRLHPDDRPLLFEEKKKLRDGEKDADRVMRVVRGDGSLRYFEKTVEFDRDAQGRPVRLAGTIRDVTQHREQRAALEEALAELRALKERLDAENVYLREEVLAAHGFDELVGDSARFTDCLRLVERVAPTSASVLVLGETGTGKELIARAIHERSPRRERALVSVNCAALPEALIESELFGHEKGAFTGAGARRRGRFELAHGGTLFLDEIGDLPLALQAKLLRVLQEREFERVGGSERVRVDVRLISATHRDLDEAVARGAFRADLYYRISTFPIRLPALRERISDVRLLAEHFVRKHGKRLGREVDSISAQTLRQLTAYEWPGNVRELENFVERALIATRGPVLHVPEAPGALLPERRGEVRRDAAPGVGTLADIEREHVRRVLEETGWIIEGPRGAAAVLDLQPSTLRSRMRKLGLRRPR